MNLKIHIVQKGETIWEIAKKYGVDFEQVKGLNPQISAPDMIMPGMKLKIPSSSKKAKTDKTKPVEPKKEMKKEVKKEMKKEAPKHASPKPIQEINEDDKQKKTQVKMEIPVLPQSKKEEMVKQEIQVPPMPQMPLQPLLQMPILETEMQMNYSPVPEQTKPIKKKVEKKNEAKKEMQEELHMQMMPSIMPMCCYMMHPCYSGMPHHFQHMHQSPIPNNYHPHMQQMPPQHMPMHQLPMKQSSDCGCSSPPPHMQGYDMYSATNNQPQPFQQQSLYNTNTNHYPLNPMETGAVNNLPRFTDNSQIKNVNQFPSPPAFPTYQKQDNLTDE